MGSLKKKFITFILITYSLCSCISSKSIYRGKIESGGRLKVSHTYYRGVEQLIMTLKKNGECINTVWLRNKPVRFIIEGVFSNHTEIKKNYYLVTDTANNQFASFDHIFFDRYKTPATMATFVPVTAEQIEMFRLLSKVLQKKKMSVKLSHQDISRIKGWVRLN